MLDEALILKARSHVRKWLARHLPIHMRFHDLDHTLLVARTAVSIAQAMGCSREEVHLLEMAALFHDLGYCQKYEGHEDVGAALAREFLKRHEVPERSVQRVESLIKATKVDHKPRGLLQKVIRDADSVKAGQVDFEEKGELLRVELEAVNGKRIGKRAWLKANLEYLEKHRFHTSHAQLRYGPQKELNLVRLRTRLRTPKDLDEPYRLAGERYHDRDLSWLAFNERVLQEARDPGVPLLERVKFLAIYSSNLDEFYRVRVASLRSLSQLRKSDRTALEVTPDQLVEHINHRAVMQQQEFGRIYRGRLLPELARAGIVILQAAHFTGQRRRWARKVFLESVAPQLLTAEVRMGNAPFIEDRKLYFVCRLRSRTEHKGERQRLVLVNIPSESLGRFIAFPGKKGRTEIAFLDDVVRIGLEEHFPGYKLASCHSVKLSRDAELYLDEEFAGNMVEKVRKSLRKRQTGVPARFLYDASMPRNTQRALRELLGLKKADMVAGGRYHHFSDLFALPVKGRDELRDAPWPPFLHPTMRHAKSTFKAFAAGDMLWHFPYHDFGMVVRWLNEAARDKAVTSIGITLYRVAQGSEVCGALLEALRNGKEVNVFVEVQARFDETSNLYWGEQLEKAGARVMYSYADLKVHCKLCQVERMERGRKVYYTYLGTGNFNEKTSRLYADSALLTCREDIAADVREVFAFLKDRSHRPQLRKLLMAPLGLRSGLEALIDKEIEHALSGRQAAITIKLNSLEDRALIRKLYDASNVGVRVRLIIRGICCLVPGVPGVSRDIEAISIVDRFLEHARIYHFHDGGADRVYMASADWMGRNLDRRVETAFPVEEPTLKAELLQMIEIQWQDRRKARRIDARLSNRYVAAKDRQHGMRAQESLYGLLLGRRMDTTSK